jgi:hypothetical protein
MSNRHPMESRQNSGFSCHVTPLKGHLGKDRDRVAQAMTRRYQASLRAHASLVPRVEKALNAKNAALDEIIGARSRRRLLDSSRQQRVTCYGLTDFRPGTFNAAVLAQAKAVAQRKSHDMLRRAGVDRAAAKKVHDAAARRVQRLTVQAYRPGTGLAVSPVGEASHALNSHKGSWFVKRPPYDGFFFEHQSYLYDGWFEFHHNIEVLEDPFTNITGKFGHFSRYWNYDAGDFDVFWLEYRSAVGFWYAPPSPGQRDMYVRIKCDKSRADLWLDEEYGASFSNSWFFSSFTVDIAELVGMERETSPRWGAVIQGDPESKWFHVPLLPANADVWVSLRVNFPPGPVFVWVGARDSRQCFSDDMSTTQTMETRYSLEEVHIAE